MAHSSRGQDSWFSTMQHGFDYRMRYFNLTPCRLLGEEHPCHGCKINGSLPFRGAFYDALV